MIALTHVQSLTVTRLPQIDDDEFVRLVVAINQFFRDAEAMSTRTCMLVRACMPRVH